MSKISILLLTKNESENLKRWGEWLPKLTIINELVLIDDKSTDNTVKVVKSFESKNLKVKVFEKNLNDDFATQRNFGISKCQNDWILSLDADEVPPEKTIKYLNELDPKNGENYAFKRDIVYLNHTLSYGQCWNDNPIKLFNKKEGKYHRPVHEIWQSNATTIYTDQKILHYSIKNLATFLEKINFYSSIRAQELYNQKHRSNLFEIILYTKLKFLDLYFFKLGFLDGVAGLILSLSLSFNSFLVRAKLWHLSQK